MDVAITEILQKNGSTYIEASCGNKSALVCLHPERVSFYPVQVICQNAAHKAWRGSGRFFNSVADAREAYKSPEMKAIIDAANSQHISGQQIPK